MSYQSPGYVPPAPYIPDSVLMERATQDDPSAFDALVERHRDALLGFVYLRLRSHDDAEDAVIATFAKAWRARHTFRGDASVKTWLYQIATRVVLDEVRTRQRQPEAQPLDVPAGAEAACAADGDVLDPITLAFDRMRQDRHQQALARALRTLPAPELELISLSYFADLEHEQIGARLGISRRMVAARLHRIRRRLRPMLADLLDECAAPAVTANNGEAATWAMAA